MRIRPFLSAAAIAAFGVSLIGSPATLAGGGVTRYVDDDGAAGAAGCGAARSAPSSIQDAIDAAGHGDTILVCPGVYQEQLMVSGAQGLTIRSVVPWKAQVKSPVVTSGPFLLGITDSDDVTVQWLRFTSLATAADVPPAEPLGCSRVESAIAVLAATDVTIRANHIDAEGPHTLGACGYGVGIEVGSLGTTGAAMASPAGVGPRAALTTAKIVNNVVRDFQSVGIGSVGWRTRTDIVQNSIQFRHRAETQACQTGTTASSLAPRRVARMADAIAGVVPAGPGLPIGQDCFAMGIVEVLGTSGTTRYNEIWSNAITDVMPAGRVGAVLLAGIVEVVQGSAVDEMAPIRPQTDAPEVRGNRIRGAYAGIALIGGDLVRVVDNVTRSTMAGVYVHQTHHARLTDNRHAETFIGIWVDDDMLPFDLGTGRTSEGNAFRRDTIPASPMLEGSCLDTTSGSGTSGTSGTANTWTDNTAPADSSSPLGICGSVTP